MRFVLEIGCYDYYDIYNKICKHNNINGNITMTTISNTYNNIFILQYCSYIIYYFCII